MLANFDNQSKGGNVMNLQLQLVFSQVFQTLSTISDVEHLKREIVGMNQTLIPLIYLQGYMMILATVTAEWVWYNHKAELDPAKAWYIAVARLTVILGILFFYSAVGVWMKLETTIHKNAHAIIAIEQANGVTNSYEQVKAPNARRKFVTPAQDALMLLPFLPVLAVLLYRSTKYYYAGSSYQWLPLLLFAVLAVSSGIVMYYSQQYIKSFDSPQPIVEQK